MVRSVRWSPEAERDLSQILNFYFNKVNARKYARKLNNIIEAEIQVIHSYPQIGKESNVQNIRVKTVGNYQIIYEITDLEILILRLWDSRRDLKSKSSGRNL